MNRKAQIQQIAFILITLFTVGLCLLIGKIVLTNVDDALTTSGLHTAESADSMDDFDAAWSIFDYMFVFVFFGLSVGLIITSFLIPTHPIFLGINIIGFFILIFVAAAIANVYGSLVDSSTGELYPAVAGGDFVIVTFFIQHLPYFVCGLVLILSVVMYAKGRGDGVYG